MRKWWGFVAAGIAACTGFIFYGDPMLLFICGVGLLSIAVSGTLIAGAIHFLAPAARPWSRVVIHRFFALVGLAVLMLLATPINAAFLQQAVVAAKAYPDTIAPFLEQYRQEHGAYPSSLDQLPSHPPVPRLLRSHGGCYGSDGKNYFFSFPEPGGFIDCWGYSSSTHAWHRST